MDLEAKRIEILTTESPNGSPSRRRKVIEKKKVAPSSIPIFDPEKFLKWITISAMFLIVTQIFFFKKIYVVYFLDNWNLYDNIFSIERTKGIRRCVDNYWTFGSDWKLF